jgi:SAM-dependent methyltransferase
MSVREFIKKLPGVAPIKGYLWRTFVNRHDKSAFLHQLKPDARILDVGCGNNSPFYTKNILPECVYTGLDIGDYNQSQPNLADQYVVTTPAKFAEAIYAFNEAFDAVISTHNLEHCDDRDMTVDAMLGAVSPGGQLYMTFPCGQSVSFPSRSGTLNYYDDPTHKGLPPDFDQLIEKIQSHGFAIEFAARSYKPWAFWFIGRLNEKKSVSENRVFISTWAYYGFEAVVQARKISQQRSTG